ncbi:alpha/beta hydrolase [Amycolatopsis albispora]|nr:alpha/beta hydrolase family protein [Amycolatopsis albispora]
MLRKALVLLLTLLSLTVTPPAVAAPGRAVVLEERLVGDRMLELLVRSPALGADVGVRLLLPEDYGSNPGKRWPTLYLLHGCCSAAEGHVEWTTYSDVEDYTEDLDALIVMPEAGDVGFYSDWLSGPAWETFHLTELRRLLEHRYRSGHVRTVAGLSMGGFGALSYAGRHPGMFRAAASYSGVVHTTLGGEPGARGLMELIAGFGEDPLKLWGDPVEQARIWAAHNPYDLARRLRGTAVFIASGNGEPGPLDPPGTAADPLEEVLGAEAVATADRLREVGVSVTTCLYGPGTHTWPYWERELHRSLPMLAKAMGVPFTPPEPLPPAC